MDRFCLLTSVALKRLLTMFFQCSIFILNISIIIVAFVLVFGFSQVALFVNKVGPYFNPHETYHYYSLPVCAPKKVKAEC